MTLEEMQPGVRVRVVVDYFDGIPIGSTGTVTPSIGDGKTSANRMVRMDETFVILVDYSNCLPVWAPRDDQPGEALPSDFEVLEMAA